MRILVTAGPTREPLDPVRFLSNRSSGKMGYAIARAALHAGHEVALISGPVHLPPPLGARFLPVQTAAEMLAAVREQVPWCDALIMAAAVADWTPRVVSPHKLKKAGTNPVLELVHTVDILQDVRTLKGTRIFIGFAAETSNPPAEARRKLESKGLDAVVANDVLRPDAGFDVDTNQVLLVTPDGGLEEWPLMSKDAVADRLIQWLNSRAPRRG